MTGLMELTWTCTPFQQLPPLDLYRILQLRSEVFVVEQQCIYQDMDNKDQPSLHLCGWAGEQLAAYARILPAGISYDHPSIGRVITNPAFRRYGFGRELMRRAILLTQNSFSDPVILIGAQQYLTEFYASFGFKQVSEPYLEDGIPHITMRLQG